MKPLKTSPRSGTRASSFAKALPSRLFGLFLSLSLVAAATVVAATVIAPAAANSPVTPAAVDPSTCDHEFSSYTAVYGEYGDSLSHSATCVKCGSVLLFDHEPVYTSTDDNFHVVTCRLCDLELRQAHIYSDGDYTDNGDGTHSGSCTLCGASTSFDHWWLPDPSFGSPGPDGHHLLCSSCGATVYSPHNPIFSSLDYDTPVGSPKKGHSKICSDCSYDFGVVSPHTYVWRASVSGDFDHHYMTCSECGDIDDTRSGTHTITSYTGEYDRYGHTGVCSVCGDVVYLPHDYVGGVCRCCPSTLPDFTDGYPDPDTEISLKPSSGSCDPSLYLSSGYEIASTFGRDAQGILDRLTLLTGVSCTDALTAWVELSPPYYGDSRDISGMTIRLPIPGGWSFRLFGDTSHFDASSDRFVESVVELTATTSPDGRFLYATVPPQCDGFILLKVGEASHTHSASASYSFGELHHYRTCSTCGSQLDVGEHTLDWTMVRASDGKSYGLLKGICTVCGYTSTAFFRGELESEEHVHIPSGEFLYDETGHWQTCKDCGAKILFDSHSFNVLTCTVCGYRRSSTSETSSTGTGAPGTSSSETGAPGTSSSETDPTGTGSSGVESGSGAGSGSSFGTETAPGGASGKHSPPLWIWIPISSVLLVSVAAGAIVAVKKKKH